MKKFLSDSKGGFSGKISEKFLITLSFSILLAGSAIYLYLFGDSVLFYQENKSLFIFSADYLKTFTNRPGGLLVYVSNFITQFYYEPVQGALIVTALILLPALVFYKILTRIGVSRSLSALLLVVPSCILLLLQTRHDFFIFYIIGYLLVSVMFFVTIVTNSRNARIIIPVSLPLFFYLAGSFAFIYLVMILTYFFITEKGNKRIVIPATAIASGFITFFIFREFLFLQPVDHLLRYPLFQNSSGAIMPLIFTLTVFYIMLPLIVMIPAHKFAGGKTNVFSFFLLIAVFIAEAVLLAHLHDSSFSGIMKLEKMVYERDWNGIIKQQEKDPGTDIISEFYFNLALSEKNQLCERLFFAPQKYGPVSLTLSSDNSQLYRSLHYYYCIGLTSEAHHLAYELMVQQGYTPETLKMLVRTELIKGNYKIAERYLNLLKKTVYYRKWARKYQEMVDNPALVNSDPELSEKMSLMPKNDFFITPDDSRTINLFLKENPENKRVFEYKVARLLLAKDLVAAVNELSGMKAAGYTSVPRAIEEAVVQYYSVTQTIPDLGGLRINQETAKRYSQYRSVLSSFKGQKSLAEAKMKKQEKNTFWYYLQFSVLSRDFNKGKPRNNYLY